MSIVLLGLDQLRPLVVRDPLGHDGAALEVVIGVATHDAALCSLLVDSWSGPSIGLLGGGASPLPP